MSRGNTSPEKKLEAVKRYLNGNESQAQIAELYGVNKSSFKQWIRNYKSLGQDAFQSKNKVYPAYLKCKAAQEYLEGQGSQCEICEKYGIRSRRQLQEWIDEYNSYGTIKVSNRERKNSMAYTKGKKTTLNERIEIVQYCVSHDCNYSEAAKKYGVSYQQARSYTIKYQNGGIEALEDKRGKRKDVDQMDELGRLRAENKILKAEKEQAEMEVSFLKKLEEIERRRG